MQNLQKSSRRHFLQHTGVALLAGFAAPRIIQGMAVYERRMPSTTAARRSTAAAWLPDPLPDAELRALALVAIDAARERGAEFADIRIGVQRICDGTTAKLGFGYGIRARLGSAWAFEHGNVMSRDAIARSARAAVVGARIAADVNTTLGWHAPEVSTPAPVVTGAWSTPVEIDPFSVPLDEYQVVANRVDEAVREYGFFRGAQSQLIWTHELRVLASTEGTVVTQSFTRGGPKTNVQASLWHNQEIWVPITMPGGQSGGFELAVRPDWEQRVLQQVEELSRWRELPTKRFDDVGRFPLVLDGRAFSALIGQTLNFALDGDRVMGREADASGLSFLRPLAPASVPSSGELSPLLTITSDRAMPSSTAVRWDDDGVVATPSTLVERGAVTDFHTTRDSAPWLAPWYQQRRRTTTLPGRSMAPTPASLPLANGGHLHVASSTSRITEADLYREMTHGFFIKGAEVTPSTNLSAGMLRPLIAAEIVQGKPVALIEDLWMSFTTLAMLKTGLAALGDATTQGTDLGTTSKGMPWQEMSNPITAPAALCKQIDVIQLPKS